MITSDEFAQRLAALCLGGGHGFPRKSRDLHILLAAATLWMEPGALYTESELNEGLGTWLERACPALRVDVVTLRRELVDRLYLDRDDAGTHYSPGTGPAGWRFADDVADVDPVEVLERARARREARRQAYQRNHDGMEE